MTVILSDFDVQGSMFLGEQRTAYNNLQCVDATDRVLFVGAGEAGELPPHWICGNGKGEGREREGWGDHLPYFPPLASASNTTLATDTYCK